MKVQRMNVATCNIGYWIKLPLCAQIRRTQRQILRCRVPMWYPTFTCEGYLLVLQTKTNNYSAVRLAFIKFSVLRSSSYSSIINAEKELCVFSRNYSSVIVTQPTKLRVGRVRRWMFLWFPLLTYMIFHWCMVTTVST